MSSPRSSQGLPVRLPARHADRAWASTTCTTGGFGYKAPRILCTQVTQARVRTCGPPHLCLNHGQLHHACLCGSRRVRRTRPAAQHAASRVQRRRHAMPRRRHLRMFWGCFEDVLPASTGLQTSLVQGLALHANGGAESWSGGPRDWARGQRRERSAADWRRTPGVGVHAPTPGPRTAPPPTSARSQVPRKAHLRRRVQRRRHAVLDRARDRARHSRPQLAGRLGGGWPEGPTASDNGSKT